MAALPADVEALLRAVHDALDIPLPASTPGDMEAHARLVERRASDARIILASLLRHPQAADPCEAAELLRAWTDQHPVTYTPQPG